MWLTPPDVIWPLDGKTVFAIVAAQRTGSNLLERSLDQLSDVTCHGELFNAEFLGFHHAESDIFAGYERTEVARRDDDLASYTQAVMSASRKPIVGYRIFQNHHNEALRNTIYNPDIKKVVLRRNLLESFVSFKMASSTNQWIVLHPGSRKEAAKVKFALEEFLVFVARHSLYYNEVYQALSSTGQTFVSVDYSELKDPDVANMIARFIGSSEEFESVPELTLKQNTRMLRNSVENYDEMITQLQKLRVRRYF
jgi:LPS sulfotransferase NodH